MNSPAFTTPAPVARPRWNPWPAAIIGYFAVFITGIATWIAVAVQNRMELVGGDYYEKEILFQQQIDAANRAGRLEAGVAIRYDAAAQSITVRLPAAHEAAHATGTIHFYRPSDAKLDRQVALALRHDGVQRLDASRLAPGLWKVQLSWKVNGEEFFFAQPVVIGSGS